MIRMVNTISGLLTLRARRFSGKMLLLYEQPDEEGILRIFEVFTAEMERQTDTGNLSVYEPKVQ